MTVRWAPARWLAGAALAPAAFWLYPALAQRLAPTYRDQGDFFFPLKLYTADRLKRGELPLWNPLSGCGEPWLANLQSGVLYPPTFLFFLPSAALAAALFLLIHFAVAVWGMHLFLRREGASEPAAFAGSAAFAASGFAASLSCYWNHFGAFAFLPALAGLARSGLASRRDRLGFASLFALQALSGSPEISAMSLAVSALFVWRARSTEAGEPEAGGFAPGVRLRAGRLAVSAALGALLAGAALAPFLELALHSDRRSALAPAERDAGTLGWTAAASLIGRSAGGSGTSYLASLAAGTLALLLAAAAAFFGERQRGRLVWLLAALAAAGIVIASGGPPGTWLRWIPPLDRIRYSSKALALPAFSLAVLAGFGLDSVRFWPPLRRALPLAALGAAGAILVLCSTQPPAARLFEAVGLLFLIALGLVRADRPLVPAGLQLGVALCLAASLAIAGRGLFRFAPEGEIRRESAEVASLQRFSGRILTPSMLSLAEYTLRDARFDASTLRRQRDSLLGYTNLLTGVRTLRTAAPLGTDGLRRITETFDGSQEVQRPAGTASARLLWTPFQPLNMGSGKVGDFFRAPINPYRPRLSFVQGFRVETDAQKAWERAARGESDWTRTVQLDREPSPRPIVGESGRRFVVASFGEDGSERVRTRVSSNGAGLLVLTDLAYPGWRAELDGRPAPLLRADGYFRAVAVPAGEHRVDFLYRPRSFLVGCVISAAALLALLVLLSRGEPRRADRIL